MGTAKLPKPMVAAKAADQPMTAEEDDMVCAHARLTMIFTVLIRKVVRTQLCLE
jgi:hypothetical protein